MISLCKTKPCTDIRLYDMIPQLTRYLLRWIVNRSLLKNGLACTRWIPPCNNLHDVMCISQEKTSPEKQLQQFSMINRTFWQSAHSAQPRRTPFGNCCLRLIDLTPCPQNRTILSNSVKSQYKDSG